MGSSTVRLLAAHALVAVRAPVEARVARRCCALYRRRRLHVAPRAAAENQRGGEFVAQTQSPPMLPRPGAAKRRFFAMRRTRPYGISSVWDRCCLAPKATLLRRACRRTGTYSCPPRTEKVPETNAPALVEFRSLRVRLEIYLCQISRSVQGYQSSELSLCWPVLPMRLRGCASRDFFGGPP